MTAYEWGNDPDKGRGWLNAADLTAKEKLRWEERSLFNFRDGYAVTSPVGSFRKNAWGLYDLHGNVAEWCNDWFGPYGSGLAVDPKGPGTGVSHVLRGGAWYHDPPTCRSAFRSRNEPTIRYMGFGFRVVLEPGP